MNMALLAYLNTFFDEIEPVVFYRSIFPEGELAESVKDPIGRYHAMAIDKDTDREHRRRNFVYNDFAELKRMIAQHRDAIIAPVTYNGLARTDENARFIYALTVDLDSLAEDGLANLCSQIDRAERIPAPTFIVWSGNGVHLYYQLSEPIACYESNLKTLKAYKKALTRLIWNRYVTDEWESPQYEAVTQGMRMVGGVTKEDENGQRDIVRAFRYGDGDKVTTEYLDSFVEEKSRIKSLAYIPRGGKDVARLLYGEEWYQRRVVRRDARKQWYCNRAVYDSWLAKVKTGAVLGHRYFSVMALVIFAIKCGISKEDVKKDAYDLIPILDALTETGSNKHFTKHDVLCALEAYKPRYATFPREWIEKLTAIDLTPKVTRRPRGKTLSRRAALDVANATKKAMKDAGRLKEGRPSKRDEVQAWRRDHPDGRKVDCMRETGLSKPTVLKHWEIRDNRPALKLEEREPQTVGDLTEVKSLDDIVRFLQALPSKERAAFIEKNREQIDDLFKRFGHDENQ